MLTTLAIILCQLRRGTAAILLCGLGTLLRAIGKVRLPAFSGFVDSGRWSLFASSVLRRSMLSRSR